MMMSTPIAAMAAPIRSNLPGVTLSTSQPQPRDIKDASVGGINPAEIGWLERGNFAYHSVCNHAKRLHQDLPDWLFCQRAYSFLLLVNNKG
ncbi:hypothetical protein SDC9_137615 [bioreactor metagenome]|uniref:Uncharacterized protein n=1 Tax=bioreactor metagenome TaxID=1076179 RepID=A0A645DM16_9ZZZZ